MEKKALIMQLRAAKSAHAIWKGNAFSILNGLEPDHSQAPVVSTFTKFGQWYYGQGQSLTAFGAYNDIDPYLIEVHRIYMKMYELTFTEVNSGGLFTSRKTVQRKNKKLAQDMMQLFDQASQKLMTAIERLEKEIMKADEMFLSTLI